MEGAYASIRWFRWSKCCGPNIENEFVDRAIGCEQAPAKSNRPLELDTDPRKVIKRGTKLVRIDCKVSMVLRSTTM